MQQTLIPYFTSEHSFLHFYFSFPLVQSESFENSLGDSFQTKEVIDFLVLVFLHIQLTEYIALLIQV